MTTWPARSPSPPGGSAPASTASTTVPIATRPAMPLRHPTEEDPVPHYRRVGDVPPKRHTQFRSPDGDLYAEELMGSDGFSSASSLLYHRRPPTALLAAEAVTDGAGDDDLAPNVP